MQAVQSKRSLVRWLLAKSCWQISAVVGHQVARLCEATGTKSLWTKSETASQQWIELDPVNRELRRAQKFLLRSQADHSMVAAFGIPQATSNATLGAVF